MWKILKSIRGGWINANLRRPPAGPYVMANLTSGHLCHFAYWRDFGNGNGCWASLDDHEMSWLQTASVAYWRPYPARPISPRF